MPCDTTLAYLAGVIDSDGFITIQRSTHSGRLYFGPRIGIAGTRREPHDLAASLWGGAVYRYEPKNPAHRAQFQWSRSGRQAATAIEDVWPYLLVKREQAELALDLWQTIEDGRHTKDDPFPWFGPNFDPEAVREAMHTEMIGLNMSRNRVGKAAAGAMLDGREHREMPHA